MKNCFEDIKTESLDACLNIETPVGISETGLYYAIHQQIAKFPMPPKYGDEGYDFESAVTVKNDIEFYPTKGFSKIAFQADMGELKVSLVGNKANKKSKQTLEFFIAGNAKKIRGFMRTMKNIPMVFLVTDREGQKLLLGDAYNPAYMSEVEGTTGKGGEDENGVKFVIESYGLQIVYEGNIQEPADEMPGTPAQQ